MSEALTHGGLANNVKVHMDWIDSEIFERDDAATFLENVHGILVPGGFGERGTEGKIQAVKFARERKVPFFGICYGLHMAVIEAARDLAGLDGAGTTEIGQPKHPVIGLMTEWTKGNEKRNAQRRRRHGRHDAPWAPIPPRSTPGSRVAEVYGATEISERHRHRYEVNTEYTEQLGKQGLKVSGWSPDGRLPEIMEIPDHPWFIGVQFHPELKSTPARAASAVHIVHRGGGTAEQARLNQPKILNARSRSSSSRPAAARTRSRSRRATRPATLPVARSMTGTRPKSDNAMRSARRPTSSSE